MNIVPLDRIAKSLSSDYGEEPIEGVLAFDVVKVSNVNGEGHFQGDFEKRRFREDQIADLLVKEGELLVVKSSGSKANILSGKTAICGPDRAGRIVASNFLLRLEVDKSTVVPRYLWYVLNSRKSKAFVKTIVGASTYPNLKWSLYASHPIPLPLLAQQRRFVDILDRAEALRAKRRAALAQLNSLIQSIFLDLFGEPAREGWTETDITGVSHPRDGSIRTGPFGSQLLHSEFVREGIAVLGIDNAVANEFRWAGRRFITEAKYRQLKRYTVRPGDVLITIMGTCGRCAVVPDDMPLAINTKHLCCITLDQSKCLPVFLHAYFLQHPVAQKYLNQTAKGAIMSGLNMGIIKQMLVLLPPMNQQREFARRVAAVEKLKAAQRASLGELDALFTSLQHRAFCGEL